MCCLADARACRHRHAQKTDCTFIIAHMYEHTQACPLPPSVLFNPELCTVHCCMAFSLFLWSGLDAHPESCYWPSFFSYFALVLPLPAHVFLSAFDTDSSLDYWPHFFCLVTLYLTARLLPTLARSWLWFCSHPSVASLLGCHWTICGTWLHQLDLVFPQCITSCTSAWQIPMLPSSCSQCLYLATCVCLQQSLLPDWRLWSSTIFSYEANSPQGKHTACT